MKLAFAVPFALCGAVLCLVSQAKALNLRLPKGCTVWGTGYRKDILRTVSLNDGYDELGGMVGKYTFLFRRTGKHSALIDIYDNGKLRYTVIDPTILLPNGDGDDPAQTFSGYQFYPSPDFRYLLVDRNLAHNESVAYIYKASYNRKMIAVNPGGLRLDDAAIQLLEARKHITDSNFGYWSRDVSFEKWAGDKVYFRSEVDTFWWGGERTKDDFGFDWIDCYDFKTGKLTIVKCAPE